MPKPSRGLIQDLFVQHAQELGAFIRRRFADDQDADDIVQDAFIRLAKYPQWDAVQNPRNFLYQTVANISVDYYRRRKLRADYLEADMEPDATCNTATSPHRHWESQQLLEQLQSWLQELTPCICPVQHRRLFVCRSGRSARPVNQ